MIDKDHGILSDASAEGPPLDTLNRRITGSPVAPRDTSISTGPNHRGQAPPN